jgi:hypothetical protein
MPTFDVRVEKLCSNPANGNEELELASDAPAWRRCVADTSHIAGGSLFQFHKSTDVFWNTYLVNLNIIHKKTFEYIVAWDICWEQMSHYIFLCVYGKTQNMHAR